MQGVLLTLRIALAVPGGYALTVGSVSVATVLLTGAMPRAEAFVLAAMLGFLFYLGILLWAFAESRLLRLALIVGLGTPCSFGLARLLAPLGGEG